MYEEKKVEEDSLILRIVLMQQYKASRTTLDRAKKD